MLFSLLTRRSLKDKMNFMHEIVLFVSYLDKNTVLSENKLICFFWALITFWIKIPVCDKTPSALLCSSVIVKTIALPQIKTYGIFRLTGFFDRKNDQAFFAITF